MPRTGLLDFTKIRNTIGFAAVLEHYGLKPEKAGTTQVKIHCPFHDDDTPSCSINQEKGIFNCFGCPAEGNVLNFIAEMEGFAENPTYSAAKLGLEIIGADVDDFKKDAADNAGPKSARRASKKPKPTSDPSDGQKTRQRGKSGSSGDKKSATPVRNLVKDIQLKLNPEHPFLADRTVGPDLATEFGMGFCARGMMRNRIAIPIHNAAGELVAYAGRWADADVPKDEPKYKLPPEFHKSLELFNLHRAAAMDKKFVVIVEGYWSTLRLHAAGVPTIALMGTSCSDIQAAKIAAAGFRYALVILDGDDAGTTAAPAVVHTLSQHVYVKTIVLDEGVKPDTMDEAIVSRLQI